MLLKKTILCATVAGALGLALSSSAASAATIVPIGTLAPSDPFFFMTSGTATSPSITANFGATIIGASKSFDDIFEFTLPQDGTGSGSLSTSFSAKSNELTIDQISIDGVSYPVTSSVGGQAFTASSIAIQKGVPNTIEVKGVTSASNVAATYVGTATFAAAVPEPASWVMMIGGLGLIGVAMRRRRAASGSSEALMKAV